MKKFILILILMLLQGCYVIKQEITVTHYANYDNLCIAVIDTKLSYENIHGGDKKELCHWTSNSGCDVEEIKFNLSSKKNPLPSGGG